VPVGLGERWPALGLARPDDDVASGVALGLTDGAGVGDGVGVMDGERVAGATDDDGTTDGGGEAVVRTRPTSSAPTSAPPAPSASARARAATCIGRRQLPGAAIRPPRKPRRGLGSRSILAITASAKSRGGRSRVAAA
jgi:hypothetical protein